MASSRPNSWCKDNEYGILLTMKNIQHSFVSREYIRYAARFHDIHTHQGADGTSFTSPLFSSNSGQKWKANIKRLKNDLYDYTIEVVPFDSNSKPDRKSILNNCFSHSVHETNEDNSKFDVVFYLKEEMQTPRILISSEQCLTTLKIKIRCMEISPKFPSRCLSDRNQMLSFIGNLLGDDVLSDVLLQTCEETFPAHKCILAAHSKVFHAMFTTDMKEKNTGIIEIKNSDPQAVKEMLKYMYTLEDPVFDDTETATEVYKISHMYEVENLFDFAHDYLVATVHASNVIHLLALGADYSDASLKDAVIRYLTKHPENKLDSSKCKAVIKKYPILFEFVLEYLGKIH